MYEGVIVGSLIYSCIVQLIALADTRFWFYRLSKSSRLVDEIVMNMDTKIRFLESTSDSRDNALLVMKECKAFILEYKTFLGAGDNSDTRKQLGLFKPISTKHDDPFDEDVRNISVPKEQRSLSTNTDTTRYSLDLKKSNITKVAAAKSFCVESGDSNKIEFL